MTSDCAAAATILVVEDEPPLLKLVNRVLVRAGHQVHQARNGDEGLALFREHADEIDAVILDVIIPPDGVGVVLDEMLASRPDLPVVLTSGDFLSRELRERLDACKGIYLGKPFVPKSLLRAIADVISDAGAVSTSGASS